MWDPYKHEWVKYNLEDEAAEILPVSDEEFLKKLKAEMEEAKKKGYSDQGPTTYRLSSALPNNHSLCHNLPLSAASVKQTEAHPNPFAGVAHRNGYLCYCVRSS